MKKQAYKLTLDEFGAHQKIINWVGEGESVLEVGCASGYMARQLCKKGCRVTGIEIDSQAARKAKRYCQKVIIGDVEDQSVIRELAEAKFETVVLADVLEHLRNPQNTLENLGRFLKREGKVIISVPNIGFLTYRLLHLLGRFDYAPWGIMDRTHLRFFTKGLILEVVKSSGLKVEKFDWVANFTQLPLYMQTLYPILGKRRWARKLEYKITGLWPEGLAVQFLLLCQTR